MQIPLALVQYSVFKLYQSILIKFVKKCYTAKRIAQKNNFTLRDNNL